MAVVKSFILQSYLQHIIDFVKSQRLKCQEMHLEDLILKVISCANRRRITPILMSKMSS